MRCECGEILGERCECDAIDPECAIEMAYVAEYQQGTYAACHDMEPDEDGLLRLNPSDPMVRSITVDINCAEHIQSRWCVPVGRSPRH